MADEVAEAVGQACERRGGGAAEGVGMTVGAHEGTGRLRRADSNPSTEGVHLPAQGQAARRRQRSAAACDSTSPNPHPIALPTTVGTFLSPLPSENRLSATKCTKSSRARCRSRTLGAVPVRPPSAL
eukprot:5497173-Pleurochrysis_carterae.AAC.1